MTTNSRYSLLEVPNLLEKHFTSMAPNQKWVGDITYLATGESWLYLAVLIDLLSRKVIGGSMTPMVCDALQMAMCRRKLCEEVNLAHGSRQPVLLDPVVPFVADPTRSEVHHEWQGKPL